MPFCKLTAADNIIIFTENNRGHLGKKKSFDNWYKRTFDDVIMCYRCNGVLRLEMEGPAQNITLLTHLDIIAHTQAHRSIFSKLFYLLVYLVVESVSVLYFWQ